MLAQLVSILFLEFWHHVEKAPAVDKLERVQAMWAQAGRCDDLL